MTAQRGDFGRPRKTRRVLPPAAASAFLAMGYTLTRESALHWCDAARRDGATEAECAEALATWEQMRADEVQTVESQPEPAAACRCSHTHPLHLYGSERCYSRSCGCARWRAKPMPRREDDGDIHEYLRQKGEIA